MTSPQMRVGASAARLCTNLGIERPALLAPMAKVAGGALAAAVSNAGGLGILGGGYGDVEWLDTQYQHVGDARVGVGIIAWNMAEGGLDALLVREPCAVWLAFGPLVEHISTVRGAGARAICQVGSAAEAVEAVDAGADVIVAQGLESGGHGRPRQPVDDVVAAISAAVPDTPLVAAGGVNDQADLDRLHQRGAAGVVLGTALYATHQALETDAAKQRLIELTGEDTIRSTVYDHVRGPLWPAGYDGRTGRTALTDEWVGNEQGLADDVAVQRDRHDRAVAANDMSVRVLWAGTGVGSISSVADAGDVIRRFDAVV